MGFNKIVQVSIGVTLILLGVILLGTAKNVMREPASVEDFKTAEPSKDSQITPQPVQEIVWSFNKKLNDGESAQSSLEPLPDYVDAPPQEREPLPNASHVFDLCRLGDSAACKSLSGSCQERDFDACFYIGKIMAQSDPTRAMSYYKFSCEQFSHADSCYELAISLSSSNSTAKPDQIAGYLNVSCFSGNPTACLKLVDMNFDPEQRDIYLAEAQRAQAVRDERK